MAENGKRKRRRSYSDLTIEDLKNNFGLALAGEDLFAKAKPIQPGDWLIETLDKGKSLFFVSEKARSELIVTPILLRVRDLLHQQITIYSGVRFDVEPEQGLKGICDFIIGKAPALPLIQAPVLVLVEAKKNDIEEGLGQCAAEMVAAQIFNQQSNSLEKTVYGAVTTGEAWLFMKLQDKLLTIDTVRYSLADLNKLLGVFVHILSA